MRRLLLALGLLLGLCPPVGAATTLLPNGKQCFTGLAGAPLVAGSINFFIPNTSTPKTTWQDAAQATQNTQPLNLDSNGCAIIYGTGSYRQQVYDGPSATGNLIWDQVTTDTSASNAVFWAGLAGGTPNVITITDSGFNGTDGSIIQFVALSTNTTGVTLNPSSFGATVVQKPTSAGPVALTAGDIVAGNTVTVTYSSSGGTFQIVGPITSSSAATTSVPTPQGYLTLLSVNSGGPIQSGDVTTATTVYYSPYVGNQIPVWNGSSYSILTFSELSLTLTASWTANAIYDVCVFSNSGVATLVTGPAWTNATAGNGTRGTGAGTTQISRVQGLWVNTVSMTGANGANTYAIPVNQCTYVGSIFIDGTNGQVSAYRTYGQSRKFGVWNPYNRVPIVLQMGDGTASWTYNTATIRPANNNTANVMTVFSGLQEEQASCDVTQTITVNNNLATGSIGLGLNSTTTFAGFLGRIQSPGPATNVTAGTEHAPYVLQPSLGINNLTALETATAPTTTTFFGTSASMLAQCRWRG